MKIHIDNRTNLSFKLIADVFERWQESSYYETNYVGRLDVLSFSCGKRNFEMQILIRKTCTLVVVVEQ